MSDDPKLRRDVQTNQRVIRSLKAKADEKRSLSDKMADRMTAIFGSMWFLIANVVLFAVWLVLNVRIIPGLEPFDPFPFGLLTTLVSLEAIILAIFVLIAQNRAAHVAELREEVDLQIDTIAEEELTKLLQMMKKLLEKHGIDEDDDPELDEMLEPTNIEKVEKVLEEQIVNPPPKHKNGDA